MYALMYFFEGYFILSKFDVKKLGRTGLSALVNKLYMRIFFSFNIECYLSSDPWRVRR